MKYIYLDEEKVFPSKIVCIGRNYVEHIKELDNEIPSSMVVFNKPNSAITSKLTSFHEEPLHYEGELCFVVKNGEYAAVGFGLDLTKRELQSQLKNKGLPWERAKAFDGSALFSPFAPLKQDDDSLFLELAINNQIIQKGGIELMMYKPQDILNELKTFMTLNDGDIVMTGTPKGVGKVNKGDVFTGKIANSAGDIVSATWQAQ